MRLALMGWMPPVALPPCHRRGPEWRPPLSVPCRQRRPPVAVIWDPRRVARGQSDRRHPAHQREPHRAAPRGGLRRAGDGRFKLEATYSHYAGKVSETQFANNTNVGNPNAIYYLYTGPAGQGRAFAPGIDPKSYSEVIGGPSLPPTCLRQEHQVAGHEGVDGRGGHRAWARRLPEVIYTHRKVEDFVQKFVTPPRERRTCRERHRLRRVLQPALANTTTAEEVRRPAVPGAYRLTDRWNVSGNYTLQINNDGNQEGEGTNQPGAPSFFPGFYPSCSTRAAPTPSDGSTASRSTGPGLDDLRLGVGRAGT